MYKRVLLLVFLILFLLYSRFSDCPTVEHLSTEKILENFKGYFYSGSNFLDELESKAEARVKPSHSQKDNLSKAGMEKEFAKDEKTGFEEKSRKLDLTLPQLTDDSMVENILQYEYQSMLPDLFTGVKIEEKEEGRMSFGGRVLMDEKFDDIELDQYRLQDIRGSIEGAKITLEVKTN